MTLRMADSIDPANLPGGMDAYGGYANGHWPDFPLIAAQHPGVPVVDFDVFGTGLGNALDMENGDADPVQFPLWWLNRALAGVYLPIGYRSIAVMPQVIGYCNNAKIPRSSYRLLSAHYGEGEHICGPGTCGGVQCDGTQWIDHGPWDESLLNPFFFAPPPPPAPPAPPPPPPFVAPPPTVGPPTPIPGAPGMSVVPFSMTTGTDGTGYVTIPIPPGCTAVVDASADVLSPSAFNPAHHDGDIDFTDAAGDRGPSGVVCTPCVGTVPANPGHQQVRLTGGIADHFYTGHAICA